MAEFIPPLTQQTLTRMMAGEKRLAQRLKTVLGDECLVWFDLPVGENRRQPDFIILLPERGLLFLEVKDWKLDTIKRVNKAHIALETDNGLKQVTHPLHQARGCALAAIETLLRDPQLRSTSEKHSGKLIFPWAYGAVFTNITQSQVQGKLPTEAREILFPDDLTLYQDEISERAADGTLQQELLGMFPYTFSNRLILPQISRIRWHLFPEIRINPTSGQTDLSTESVDAANQALPENIKIMDIEQEKLARSLGAGHRVIHGVSGSGKTLVLGFRCVQLAQALPAKPILVLCFNITLAAKLRAVMATKGVAKQVEICHFHEWCKRQLKAYQIPWKKSAKSVPEQLVERMTQALAKGQIPPGQYSAVLIDEGHDFEPEWLKLAVQMVDPASGSLLLLYDDTQSIYKTRAGLGFSLSSVGIQARGRTTILRRNYRNTQQILDFAYRFVAEYITIRSAADEDQIPLIQPESSGDSGSKPAVKRLNNFWKEAEHAVNCLKKWREQGFAWKDMAVLYATTQSDHGGKLTAQMKKATIPFIWLSNREDKLTYDPTDDQVSVLTLYSSKGLEFSCVIIIGVGQMKEAEADLAHGARLLYVGMTRAQTRLLLSLSDDNPYTHRLLQLAAA